MLERREHSLRALKEYTELIDFLGSGGDIALRSMFLGFSAEAIGASRVTFYFHDEENDLLFPNVTMVYKKGKLVPYDYYTELKDVVIKSGEDICGMVIKNKEPLFLDHLQDSKDYKGYVDRKIKLKVNSVMALPLMASNNIIGIVELANSSDNRKLSEIDFYVVSIICHLTMSAMEKVKLYNWSITDNLTKLYNYHYLQVALEKELTRVKRYPKDLGVILIDVDNFKNINDSYGHPFGNRVLKGIADIIMESIRKDVDLPVRYGGDEFLILLPETNFGGAKLIAKRIMQKLKPVTFKFRSQHFVKPTVSIGLTAAKKDDPINQGKLIKKADDALYMAKKRGKNRIATSL
ncbi:MAG: GGDEF domain-containing protein [Spirochaetes bacterium]|nr:GGDEF domain-containing protein [Spirochaetota bacterium]